jgi:hypothetical protein
LWISGGFDRRPQTINNSPTLIGASCQQVSSWFKKLICKAKIGLSTEFGAA